MKVHEIANITGGILSAGNKAETSITSICFDSRQATHQPGELFIALKGRQYNGHQYIPQLIAKGTQNFIIEETLEGAHGVNLIQVPSSLEALQKLAQHQRGEFSGEVIGITGSNGKTIVKEWLTVLLSIRKKVLASPKSFNSQLGVPISVWPLTSLYDIGVFEAGISQPGEMNKLQKILRPQTGIFTNIGSAHEENFESIEQKVHEKLQLFNDSEVLVYDSDDHLLASIIEKEFKGEKIGWSRNPESALAAIKQEHGIEVRWKGKSYQFTTSLLDDASFQNIVHCIVTALQFGLLNEDIQTQLNKLRPVQMRLELKKGQNGNYIIDDTYNNDLAGLSKALNFMDQQSSGSKKTVILSDFIQSKTSKSDFKKLNDLLISKGIDQLIGIGPQLESNKELFSIRGTFFTSTEALMTSEKLDELSDQLILIKGARQFALERVSLELSEKVHKTSLEINLDALAHNLNFYRSLLKPTTKVMAVIKAFAYGSGSTEVARLLEYNQVDYLAVAYVDEGITLRKDGIKTPIMVMNPGEDDVYGMIRHGLEPEVYNIRQLIHFHDTFKSLGKRLPLHLVINTGMNRLGFDADQLADLKETLSGLDSLDVKSIFSHLAASDDSDEEPFSLRQIQDFKSAAESIAAMLPNRPLLHILNSGGITRFTEHQMDMVRLGIGLHGVEVNKKFQGRLQKPARLKTVISQIRKVKQGESIGYGRKGKAIDDMEIAVIAIGYADGYLRIFSNGNAYVMVNGKKAQTIGNVCMDMTMIDVTGLEAKEGDEVIVFGESPTVNQLADWANTIPYEILTNVSGRVKRVYYSE
ncbi:bifunctional UDP-N-acetylmuramoyl-tripeptide:D-alanyl-D-alanine ligase/alanine racemase [Roseivirga sp.]|uniref:bifunctional UDP-N-acetylmuramoyl-tripeptide:D-alanyl-D-alanine ligase/alanine racemase n=1 Tax=Roseivirga sp. TaxID=1964215 RepID=UPI003B51E649